MNNYFDKEDVRNIQQLNKVTGMQHRHKPFDLNNPEDLNQAFMYTVCAFLDYFHYSSELGELLEKYDESLEHYDTATWINSTFCPDKADSLSMKAYDSLSEALDHFTELSDRAEEECMEMLSVILSSNSEIQKKILGCSYQLDSELIEKIIDNVQTNIPELEYHYSMPEAFESFIAFINETISVDMKVY